MNNLAVIRNFMVDNQINYLLVNSTNEFLVEYNTLEENSRYKLTNFSGSTGEALVTPDNVYLFVDGRYHIQADLEVDHENITVVKLQQGQKYIEELLNLIPENESLGLFSKKNSQAKIEKIASERNIILFSVDPLDEICENSTVENIVLDITLTGLSSEEKIAKFSQNLAADEAIYITDCDEVSYLFNLRDFSQNFSSKIKGKAIILKDNSVLFTLKNLEKSEEYLKTLDKKIFVDKSSINGYDYNLIGDRARELKNNPVKKMKSLKNDAELNHLKDAFKRTDKAVYAIRDYIEHNDNISEFDIAVQLEKEFKKQGALGLSFNSIVAKDKNSALAHYSKSSKDEIIKDGSLVLIDCGGYFEGGLATDITRVFVKGEPSEFHKKIYTNVLKAFLQAFNFENPQNGYEIDKKVREFFDTQDLDGFVFNHGLGHGIGINVHEYPPNLSSHEMAKVPFENGMCFSIEPGLYKENCFGVRLENSCYFVDGKIHSFVNMNYEKKLIDYSMLSEQELKWLDEFEVL
ncbi:M24 family metallopeptidase [bacterium]|nr:M24 family metallopeptidase [bacterium]